MNTPTNNTEFLTATYADLRRRYNAAEEAGEPILKLWDQMQAALAALQEAKKNALPCYPQGSAERRRVEVEGMTN